MSQYDARAKRCLTELVVKNEIKRNKVYFNLGYTRIT